MNANSINSQNNNKFQRHKFGYSQRQKPNEQEKNIAINHNHNGPARQISFGGSALSLSEKLGERVVESNAVNKLVNLVSENEVAYNAIYSLFIAGILKPTAIIAQTKNDKEDGGNKDGVMIATKNLLQAFTGSFLSLTIGGGFIKKIWDNIENNIKLLTLNEDKIEVVEADSQRAKEVAADIIKAKHNNLSSKFKRAKEEFSTQSGLAKISGFTKALFKKIDYKPDKNSKEVTDKAKEIVSNFKKNHETIFRKNPDYIKELVENFQKLENNPCIAREELKKGSHLFEAFESCWKNSTGAITTTSKAKISSLLLPSVAAFIMAKRCIEKQDKIDEQKEKNKNTPSLLLNSTFKKDLEKFSQFSKDKQDNPLSFKGTIDSALDFATRGVEHIAMSKTGEGAVKLLKRSKTPSATMGDIESWGLTAYWLGSTTISKRIEPERKLGLNVNTLLVTVLATIFSHLVDLFTDPIIKTAEKAYLNKLTNVGKEIEKLGKNASESQISDIVKNATSKLFNAANVQKALSDKNFWTNKEHTKELENFAYKYCKKFAKFKSLTIFTLVVRFLVPVYTVNLSKLVKKKILEWQKNKQNTNENQTKKA